MDTHQVSSCAALSNDTHKKMCEVEQWTEEMSEQTKPKKETTTKVGLKTCTMDINHTLTVKPLPPVES